MRYIGNAPAIEIVQYAGSKWDYINTGNPSLTTNPERIGETWLNILTGEEFVCTDNSAGLNVWVGSFGTEIAPINAGWTFALHGESTLGTYTDSATEIVLTPAQTVVNSVSMIKETTRQSIEVNISIAGDGVNDVSYPTFGFGSTPVVPLGGGANSWWHTGLDDGYYCVLQSLATGQIQVKKASGGVSYSVFTVTSALDWEADSPITYKLVRSGTALVLYENGLELGRGVDATFLTSSHAIISQAEYSTGIGAVLTVHGITL